MGGEGGQSTSPSWPGVSPSPSSHSRLPSLRSPSTSVLESVGTRQLRARPANLLPPKPQGASEGRRVKTAFTEAEVSG